MASIVSWNVRGLNWPNKQEDLKLFLHKNKVGLIDFLETKVKIPKVDIIANVLFPRWNWHHNFHNNPKGRIWLAWNPVVYHVDILFTTDQMIHGRVRQLHTNNSFIISVVYGMNTITQRQQLWEDIFDLIPQNEAWCVLGDFNAVRSMEERIGGDPVTEYEIQELNSMMENCELQEAPTVGAFYTWTNKKIWSRLDRVLINDL